MCKIWYETGLKPSLYHAKKMQCCVRFFVNLFTSLKIKYCRKHNEPLFKCLTTHLHASFRYSRSKLTDKKLVKPSQHTSEADTYSLILLFANEKLLNNEDAVLNLDSFITTLKFCFKHLFFTQFKIRNTDPMMCKNKKSMKPTLAVLVTVFLIS